MRILSAFIFLFSIPTTVHSQLPVSKDCRNCDLSQLHAVLIKNKISDVEKVHAFYSWIANNIAYDVAEARSPSGNIQKQNTDEVLKNKKAVCHGYSVLFRELCNLSQIKCHLVSGYHRQENRFNNAGHTWNIVFAGGKWQPVDVTWAAGGVTGSGFVREYSEKYLFSSPEDFLTEHYPLDPMWQLVPYPVKVNHFKQPSFSYKLAADHKVYNFNDTIAAWEKLDSLDGELQSANRMVRFNPGDVMASQHLGYVLVNIGNREFAKGTRLIEKLYGKAKPVMKQDADEFSHQLDSIEHYLINAEAFYKKVNSLNAFDNQVVKNNLAALQSNLKIVKSEKAKLR